MKPISSTNKSSLNRIVLVVIGVIFITFLIIHLLSDSHPLTYAELKEQESLISDRDTYELMNTLFYRSDSVSKDSMDFVKIHSLSLKHSQQLKAFISSLDDSLVSLEERNYMLKNLSDDSELWDHTLLKNVWCISPSDLEEIYKNDTVDYWTAYRAKFGIYGEHHYSKPIFNRSKTVAVIEHSGQGGALLGSGEIRCYVKENGMWRLLKEQLLWIS